MEFVFENCVGTLLKEAKHPIKLLFLDICLLLRQLEIVYEHIPTVFLLKSHRWWGPELKDNFFQSLVWPTFQKLTSDMEYLQNSLSSWVWCLGYCGKIWVRASTQIQLMTPQSEQSVINTCKFGIIEETCNVVISTKETYHAFPCLCKLSCTLYPTVWHVGLLSIIAKRSWFQESFFWAKIYRRFSKNKCASQGWPRDCSIHSSNKNVAN